LLLRASFTSRGDRPKCAATTRPSSPFVAERVDAAALAVALAGAVDQRQVTRLPAVQEALLQRQQQFIRRADADEARGGDRIAALDDRHGLGGRGDLVSHGTATS